jgi:hypothetical protein
VRRVRRVLEVPRVRRVLKVREEFSLVQQPSRNP